VPEPARAAMRRYFEQASTAMINQNPLIQPS